MLFEEERRTALAFQTSLLPQAPPAVDGLEVAYKYVPAKPLETHGQGIQTQVGGDWYDIIALSAGRVGIVIGDVEGRGARAAAIMGQLRAALRAFAQDDKPPAEILRRLDDWCRTLGPSQAEEHGFPAADPPIVSCTYLVYDAWSRSLSFANAGHDAPLLVTGLDVGQMEIEHKGVLLGVRGKGIAGVPAYREEIRHLDPGSTLVFYTDGLTDRRQRADGDRALHRGRGAADAAARRSGRSPAAASRTSRRPPSRPFPGDIDDDMAIVVVRTSATDLASWEGNFPAEPIKVSEARRLAHRHVRPLGDGSRAGRPGLPAGVRGGHERRAARGDLAQPAERVRRGGARRGGGTGRRAWPQPGRQPGPELAAMTRTTLLADWPDLPSAVGRGGLAGKEFTLRLRRGTASIWVEVFDADLRLPRIRNAGENDEGGRGLYLVDQLATRWGSRPTHDGKAVWFEVPLSGGISGR